MRRLLVAIDGPAGAGKSTISQKLSEALGYQLLDTGAIYRSLALLADEKSMQWSDETGLVQLAEDLNISFKVVDGKNRVYVDKRDVSQEIRAPKISQGASVVSAHPKVRDALLGLQRRLGGQGGVVAEGRDIGTVVFPNADIKFFLTASAKERAKRRTAELVAQGDDADFKEVLEEISKRDRRDSGRLVAPLKAADDAVQVDSSSMSLEEVLEHMLNLVGERAAQ